MGYAPSAEDLKRFRGQRAAILARLGRGPATNQDLILIAARFGGRIEELRKAGYQIRTERLGPGVFRYTLTGYREPVLPGQLGLFAEGA